VIPPWRRRGDPSAALDEVAVAAERLAALLAAGAAPAAAWRYLAESQEPSTVLGLAADAAWQGLPLAPVLARAPTPDAWRRVAVLADLAALVGAPLTDALRRAASGLRGGAELHRAVATSVAGPAASARLTLLLPPGSALLGWAFGFDVPGAILSPVGAGALVLAALLLAGAQRWSARLIRNASAVALHRGVGLELVALAVRAGRPTSAAAVDAREAAAAAGLSIEQDLADVDRLVGFAERSGAPLAALLDAEADRIRQLVLADARRRAAVLAAQLLVPLGALVLPAFLLAGALPIGLAVLSSTALSW
jgi:tight adherence protein B